MKESCGTHVLDKVSWVYSSARLSLGVETDEGYG
jgi:hypothetical protein